MNVVSYGSNSRILPPFYGDRSIIQQFDTQFNKYLDSVSLYITVFPNISRDYFIKLIIIDGDQNICFTKDVYMGDVQKTGYFKIDIKIELLRNKLYYLCLDSLEQGNQKNYICLSIGYRKKMMNLFLNNKFSVGQLCCNFNFK